MEDHTPSKNLVCLVCLVCGEGKWVVQGAGEKWAPDPEPAPHTNPPFLRRRLGNLALGTNRVKDEQGLIPESRKVRNAHLRTPQSFSTPPGSSLSHPTVDTRSLFIRCWNSILPRSTSPSFTHDTMAMLSVSNRTFCTPPVAADPRRYEATKPQSVV